MKGSRFWHGVKTCIKEQKTTQAALAEKCGIGFRTFTNWIYRDIEPNLDRALLIAWTLHTTVEALYGFNREGAPDLPDEIRKITDTAKQLNPNGRREALALLETLKQFHGRKKQRP
jgi:DNA-binding XRE family transcriptional regulator